MFPLKHPTGDLLDSKTYPLGEKSEQPDFGNATTLVALSHTPLEHRLYSAMLAGVETLSSGFTAKSLMTITGIRSLSSVRRGLEGLMVKLSIDKFGNHNVENKREQAHAYRVYPPEEVIARRKRVDGTSLSRYGNVPSANNGNHSFSKAIARVVENSTLSRREAQVALCCVEGLTNADIGRRLKVSEQTVKFHLRHIYVKFAVRRRAELISKLLM